MLRDVNREYIPGSFRSGVIPEFHFTEQISGTFHFQNMETLLKMKKNGKLPDVVIKNFFGAENSTKRPIKHNSTENLQNLKNKLILTDY